MALETDTLSGTIIGDQIEIGGLLGRGGMGNVYEAYNKGLGCVVAVKVLHPKLIESNDAIKRFQSEARVASLVQHPNLVVVHSFGLLNQKIPYIVMEKLDGVSISQYLLEHNTMDTERFQQVFQQCCAGLAAIHARGIVHRDIKPSNIVLLLQANEWQVKIADFGIAKALFSESDKAAQKLTQTGEVIGTPLYMSPEQCQSQPLDQRSDIYSLGCVMYECLTGKRPFDSDNPFEVMVQHSSEEPKPLDAIRPELKKHAALTAVVMHTLQKSPEQRPQTMHKLLEELHEAESGQAPVWLRAKKQPSHVSRLLKRAIVPTLLIAITTLSIRLLLDQRSPGKPASSASDETIAQEIYNEAGRSKSNSRYADAAHQYGLYLSRMFRIKSESGHWVLAPTTNKLETIAQVARAASALDLCEVNTGKKWPEPQPWYQLCDAITDLQRSGQNPADKTYDIMRDKVGAFQIAIGNNSGQVPPAQLRLAGIIQHRLGRGLELSLEHNPELPINHREIFSEALKRYLFAENYYQMTAKANPVKRMERSINKGRIGAMQVRLGQFDAASKNLESALATDDWLESDRSKGTVDALNDLAYTNICLGRLPAAIENYEQVLAVLNEHLTARRIEPASYDTLRADALKDRGDCWSLSGNPREAISLYKQALARKIANNKLRADLAVNIAYEQMRSGDTRSATTMLQEARSSIKMANESKKLSFIMAKLFYVEARLLEIEKRSAEAASTYARALNEIKDMGALINYRHLLWADMIANASIRTTKTGGSTSGAAALVKQRSDFMVAQPELAAVVARYQLNR